MKRHILNMKCKKKCFVLVAVAVTLIGVLWGALGRPDVETCVRNGASYFEKGEYKKAFAEYDRAIEIDPKEAAAYAGRAKVYYIAEENDIALADAEKAITLNSDFAPAYEICAFARAAQKDYEGALDYINRAMALQPDETLWYLVRAAIYGEKGDNKLFFADFNKGENAAGAEEKSKEIDFLGRGIIHYPENTKQDVAHYTHILEINPNAEKTRWNRARYYDECGEYEKAAADYAKAIELNPNRIEYYEQRAYFYYRNGRFEEEAADLERAKDLIMKGKHDA